MKHRIVTFSGTSQYRTGGISACGLAAMNCVRLILSKENEGLSGQALLENVLSRSTMEEIMSICSGWASNAHLEIDSDIYRVPIFEKTLRMTGFNYGTPGLETFKDLLTNLQSLTKPSRSAAAVITRPPEIISVVRISHHPKEKPVFVAFDSHPRARYPEGAAFIITDSLEHMASEINDILVLDPNILKDSSLQWQAQLLANFSVHFFISREPPESKAELIQTVLDCSLQVLTLKAQIADLQSQAEVHRSISERLEGEVEQLQHQCERQRKKLDERLCTRCTRPSRPEEGTTSSLKPVHTVSDDREVASLLQLHYLEEDQKLATERRELAAHVQAVFDCGVCFDQLPEDYLVKIEPCNHPFCRDCLQQHVRTKLDEQRFPIFCPSCNTGESLQSEIDNELLEIVGVSEREFSAFEEMQLAAFSVLLHCRKCQTGVFVDRAEFQAATIIACPLPTCNHVWCKACLQDVQVGGPQHSCDGSSELKRLMEEQGWKSCPGCETPIQKVDGCNHMTCVARGCNTHFCYLCGENIVQSALPSAIREAVQGHYSRCQLFAIQ